LRLAVCGLVGLPAVVFSVALPIGAVYVWLTTGLSPLTQVREGGWRAVLVMWPIVGSLFASIHVFGAFLEGGAQGRAAIASITICLLALWVLALRRGRGYAHTIVRRWL
jgi:hypothetical protein